MLDCLLPRECCVNTVDFSFMIPRLPTAPPSLSPRSIPPQPPASGLLRQQVAEAPASLAPPPAADATEKY